METPVFVPFTEMTLVELTAMSQEQLEANAVACRVSVQEIHDHMTKLAEEGGIIKEAPVAEAPVETPVVEEAPTTVQEAPVELGNTLGNVPAEQATGTETTN